MAFQTQVYAEPALGVQGQRYGGNPARYYLPTPLAGENGVTVGRCVWRVATDATGQTVANTGTGAPAGIACREKTVPQEMFAEATMRIPAGYPVPVMQEGDVVLVSTTPAVVGQRVFAKLATGEVSTAAPGATVSGAVETVFEVRKAAPANEPFVASSLVSVAVAVAP